MKVSIQGEELHLYERVGRYQLEPIVQTVGEDFIFTIDVYREMNGLRRYFPKVYLYELYRLQASFPSRANNSTPFEWHRLLVEDLSWSAHRMNSLEAVLEYVLSDIKYRFSVTGPTTLPTT